jgi:hypothetical protein
MANPWTDGPRELIQHAADHLRLAGDFDRRIAMISVDNAVELMIKTYLGLPERTRRSKGPGRKELEAASESFPDLLDLLNTHAASKITGLSLDDIEWYHRLRNQLYHSGNGITVEQSKVETYFQLALTLFENLFGFSPAISDATATQSKIGKFLQLWNHFDSALRKQLPPKEDFAYYWKRDHLHSVAPEAAILWDALTSFRNELVHGLATPTTAAMNENLAKLKRLLVLIGADA